MTLHIKPRHLAIAVVVGALVAGGGYAFATTREHVIHACISRTRVLSVPASGSCGKRSIALAWNQQGPRGAAGPKGARGASGSPGTPATVSVGAVTTGAAGSQASVTNVGSASNAKLDFTIPQGEAGTNGTDGSNSGPTAYGQIWMDSTSAKPATGVGVNVLEVSGGDGSADVWVDNCTAATPAEPIITVTADRDSADDLPNHPNNTPNTAVAYVTGYGSDGTGNHIAEFSVTTSNPSTGLVVNSDFSFTVTC